MTLNDLNHKEANTAPTLALHNSISALMHVKLFGRQFAKLNLVWLGNLYHVHSKYGMCGLKKCSGYLKNVVQMIQFYHSFISELNLCSCGCVWGTHCLALRWEISQVPESLSCPKKSTVVSKAGCDTLLSSLLWLSDSLSWVPLLPLQKRLLVRKYPVSPPEAGLGASFLV